MLVSDTGKSLQEREKDGTGLRLRSCRAIVDLHEGGMHAYPRSDGKGAMFRIELPINPIPGILS